MVLEKGYVHLESNIHMCFYVTWDELSLYIWFVCGAIWEDVLRIYSFLGNQKPYIRGL